MIASARCLERYLIGTGGGAYKESDTASSEF